MCAQGELMSLNCHSLCVSALSLKGVLSRVDPPVALNCQDGFQQATPLNWNK